jgi:hypothetical protein
MVTHQIRCRVAILLMVLHTPHMAMELAGQARNHSTLASADGTLAGTVTASGWAHGGVGASGDEPSTRGGPCSVEGVRLLLLRCCQVLSATWVFVIMLRHARVPSGTRSL